MRSTSHPGVVSYAVQGQDNELLFFNNGGIGFTLYVHGKTAALGALPVWNGERHAVCATWRSNDGTWQVYTDGVLQASGWGLNVGGKVRSGGTWILAQDQDTVGGGFDRNQAFSGELSQVNLWDRVLTPAEIGTDFCGQHGNVIDWATTDIKVLGQATNDEYRCGCPKIYYINVNGVCYKYYPEAKTYAQAQQTCAADGGLLAMPKDDQTNNLINSLGSGNRWIGLTDVANEGQWVFENGQALESNGYSNWNLVEPNGGSGENYAAFSWTGSGWQDWPGNSAMPFTCQIGEDLE
ncbi:neuronal pentraxin-2-like [Branchiostoma floridae]|uniref:Neuronal pentraxin-2-like n=1 Tax=Branchiostoma floridae TaxID=7739 RepID=A0A9J7KUQ4_BRAFL|nr:neuronal pentraxin-2-like [Branchiostoma floridae]